MNNEYDRDDGEQVAYTFNVNTFGMINIESQKIPTSQELIDSASQKAAKILNVELKDINKLKFLRMYIALYSLCGYHPSNQSEGDNMMRWWLNTENKHLGYIPVNYIHHTLQLDEIIRYLESSTNH